MLDDERYASVLETIYCAKSLAELEKQLKDIQKVYSACNIVYHAVAIPGVEQENPVLLLTYDPSWVSLYKENNYFQIDPVVKSGRNGFLPVDWQNVDRDSTTARRFFARADSHGVGRNGISLPIRGANGERAIFTVTSNASNEEWAANRIVYMRDFQMIGHYVHHRVLDLSGMRPRGSSRKPSAREVQCLKAISKGRTPKQIAADLQISESAVRLYLHSIRSKLGCATITQAVLTARNLNIIES